MPNSLGFAVFSMTLWAILGGGKIAAIVAIIATALIWREA